MGAERLQPVHEAERAVNPVPRRLADISLAAQLIGFTPNVSLRDGLASLVAWRTRERGAPPESAGQAA
jgi:UDP-glucose 4-epimerase